MLRLFPFSPDKPDVSRHLIFLHGLGGHPTTTWSVQRRGVLTPWPKWLDKEFSELQTWSVGYDASPHAWRGGALPISDRGLTVLNLLLDEKRLRTGSIVLAGHSMGGLVLKQVLRTAESEGKSNAHAKSLIERTEATIFLGTPHGGALLASVAKCLPIRTSAAIHGLVRNDPAARDLDRWYGQFRLHRDLHQLNIIETKPPKFWGITLPRLFMVVDELSASSTGGETVKPVDYDHINVCKPESQSSPIYTSIRSFIERLDEAKVQRELSAMRDREASEVEPSALAELSKAIHSLNSRAAPADPSLADAAIYRAILDLRQRRFFDKIALEQLSNVVNEITTGRLASGSAAARSVGLAWCARIASTSYPAYAATWIAASAKLASPPELHIAKAIASIHHSTGIAGRANLVAIGSPEAIGAAILVTMHQCGPQAVIEWFDNASLDLSGVDSDGKFGVLQAMVMLDDWSRALDMTNALTDDDYQSVPALAQLAANVFLVSCVPAELRGYVVTYYPHPGFFIPFSALSEDQARLRRAVELFKEASEGASRLQLPSIAGASLARAYAIELMDPTVSENARGALREALEKRNADLSLIALALNELDDVDVESVTRSIDQRVALTGRSDAYVAQVRLQLILRDSDAERRVDRFEQHRDVIRAHLGTQFSGVAEINVLVSAGYRSRAHSVLKDMCDAGLGADDESRLRDQIDKNEDSGPVEDLIQRFARDPQIGDLQRICEALANSRRWSELVPYANELHDRTHALVDLELLAEALYSDSRTAELSSLLESHSGSLDKSTRLLRIQCWVLYDMGEFERCSDMLREAKGNDQRALRDLAINVIIASGDWDALETFVNDEWDDRANRSDSELARAAALGQQVGAGRTIDLIREAASRGNDNPQVLAECYLLATRSGLDHDAAVAAWIQRAAELSDNDSGPIKRIDLGELLSEQSGWQSGKDHVIDLVVDGSIPMSMATSRLGGSLVQRITQVAAINSELKAGRREAIYASSGAPRPSMPLSNYAIDASGLLELDYLDVLPDVIEASKGVTIPHATLGWFFAERARLTHHQPSQVADARLVDRLMSSNKVFIFVPDSVNDKNLSRKVGRDLADMLLAAAQREASSESIKVIHSFPVHSLGSFMKETVDLGSMAGVITGCSDLLRSLHSNGHLTRARLEECLSYCQLAGHDWPTSHDLAPSSALLVDSSAISALLHLNLLEVVTNAGYRVEVSASVASDYRALVAHDSRTRESLQHIESIRRVLRDGLKSKKVTASPLSRDRQSRHGLPRDIGTDPAAQIVSLAASVTFVASGDRFINKHPNIEVDGSLVPTTDVHAILTRLSSEKKISDAVYADKIAMMRRAGFALIPVRQEELSRLVIDARTDGTKVMESAELLAISESIDQMRVCGLPKLPEESPWLDELLRAGLRTIGKCWSECPAGDAALKATWVWRLIDPVMWSFTLAKIGADFITARNHAIYGLIIEFASLEESARIHAQRWLDDSLIADIERDDPRSFSWIVSRAKKMVEDTIKSVGNKAGQA